MKKIFIPVFFLICLFGFYSDANGQADCNTAAPFCTSTGVNFPASTSTTAPAGPDYGCLGTQPNPAWYYLNVATSGNIQINLSNSANVDIDFIIWGPFASQAAMCTAIFNQSAGSGVDCSYSTASNEQVDIPNAQAGEWYMLLITNYSGQPTNISAVAGNAPGVDGTTNCAILCNMTGLTANPGPCNSATNTYTLTGTISATNPPATGTLTVTSSCGGSQTFNMPLASPVNYTISNITATGGPCTVTATYSADPTCTMTVNYNSPAPCIVSPCLINFFDANISACDPATSTYTVNGQIQFTNPPATGQLIVETCGGNQQVFNPPFVSPINYNITGIPADATPNCDVNVYFTSDPACNQTIGPYTEPFCPCNMDNMFVNIGACDPSSNTFTVTVDLDFTSPPTSGSLQVTVCGVTQNLPMPATSPQTFTFSGLPADGSACTADAFFTADPACGNSLNFTSPNGCLCPTDAGTFTDNMNGNSNNNQILCWNDALNITADGNFVPSDDFTVGWTPPPAPFYDPGLWLAVYDCPPTVFPPGDLLSDPCFLGIYSTTNGNWSILNNIGDGSTLYFAPITMYSMTDGIYAIAINGGDWCWDLGEIFPITFLEEITATGVENCAAGTVTVTVNGGTPALNGSNFTASNLSPATASFNNTTCTDGGTIVISGLQNGDMYSFDIVDNSGCPITYSGGPFVGPVATNITPVGPFCLSDPSVNLVVAPAVAGTWSGTGITNATTGTFDPATAGVGGPYTITFTPSGCYLPSTTNIIVNDVFDATVSPAGPFCQSNANTFLGAADPGGTWSGTGIVNSATGEFSPTTAGPGTWTITYTISGACGDVGTTNIQVIADADATINPAGPFCETDPAVNLTAAQTGGVWSGTGITSSANGTFNPASSGPGTFVITYNISGVCGDQDTETIVVNPLIQSTITPAGPFCEDDNAVTLTAANPGGTWSGTGITNASAGTFDPDVAGPGTWTITYTISGSCGTTSTVDIVVNPVPVPTFTADITSGCVPLTVIFSDNTTPVAASTVWNISNGASSVDNGFYQYTFTDPGTYSVTLTLTSAQGCTGTTTITNMINVYPNPVADFAFGPYDASVLNSTVNFTNQSTGADLYLWDFAGLGTSTQTNPSFNFPTDAPGTYTVCLEAATVNGCIDSTCQTIIINDIFIIYVPNAFTPDNDQINDVFLPILSGIDPLSYNLMIFDRWGELIFETNNYGESWDGYYRGILSKEDVYVWKIVVKDAIYEKRHEYIGHVTLLK